MSELRGEHTLFCLRAKDWEIVRLLADWTLSGFRRRAGAIVSPRVAWQRFRRTCHVVARKPRIDAAEIVRVTTQTTPEGATHWSTCKLGTKLGISDTTVLKVWRANGLKPHLVETFKVSRDPKFVEKLEDIVGLYMSPPEHALVLCCNEKS
jgi:hypothetical protein